MQMIVLLYLCAAFVTVDHRILIDLECGWASLGQPWSGSLPVSHRRFSLAAAMYHLVPFCPGVCPRILSWDLPCLPPLGHILSTFWGHLIPLFTQMISSCTWQTCFKPHNVAKLSVLQDCINVIKKWIAVTKYTKKSKELKLNYLESTKYFLFWLNQRKRLQYHTFKYGIISQGQNFNVPEILGLSLQPLTLLQAK